MRSAKQNKRKPTKRKVPDEYSGQAFPGRTSDARCVLGWFRDIAAPAVLRSFSFPFLHFESLRLMPAGPSPSCKDLRDWTFPPIRGARGSKRANPYMMVMGRLASG